MTAQCILLPFEAEAIFATHNVTGDTTKILLTQGVLDNATIDKMANIIANPPDTALKEAIIERTSASEDQKLHYLLNDLQPGDMKPSK